MIKSPSNIQSLSPRFQNTLAILFLLILSVIFHLRLFTPFSLYTSQDFGRGDLTHFNYPIKTFYADSIKNFELPLWTDLIAQGYPLFSEGQIGTFYLPNLILFFLLPAPWAFNLSYVVIYFLASSGVFFYCRYLKLKTIPSIFSAIAYAFSMVFVSHTIHFNVIQTASLIPWILFSTEKFLDRPSRIYAAVLSFLISQQIFAGFIQISFYTLVTLTALIVYRKYQDKLPWKKVLIVFIVLISGLILSGIQLLPTMELMPLAFDPSLGNPSEYVTWIKFKIHHLWYYLNPFIYADPSTARYALNRHEGLFWENNAYLGIPPLIFALFALKFVKKTNKLLFFLGVIIFWLLFSLGWLFFLYSMPIFSGFRVPQRSLFIINLFIAILAGFGLEKIMEFSARTFKRLRIPVNYAASAVVLVLYANLYFLLTPYNGVLEAGIWLKEPETVKFLREKLDGGRIYSVGWEEDWKRVYYNESAGWRSEKAESLLATRAPLNPNANMVYSIPSADGYAGRLTKRFNFLKDEISEGVIEEKDDIKLSTASGKLLSMQGVKYVVATKPVTSYQFKKIYDYTEEKSKSHFWIYENLEYLGRIYPVTGYYLVLSDGAFANTLHSEEFNPKNTALVESVFPQATFSAQVNISELESKSNNLKFKTNSSEAAFIVIADSFYPGWKADIDGNITDIFPVNINSKGIIVPPGEHKIALSYEPDSLKKGGLISLGGLIFITALVAKFL